MRPKNLRVGLVDASWKEVYGVYGMGLVDALWKEVFGGEVPFTKHPGKICAGP